jgi:hypothetical protein
LKVREEDLQEILLKRSSLMNLMEDPMGAVTASLKGGGEKRYKSSF